MTVESTTRPKTVIEGEEDNGHFFVSTVYFWVTDKSLTKALDRIRKQYAGEREETKERALANVFLVPLPSTAAYDIGMYMPLEVDAQFLWQGKLFPKEEHQL